MKSSVFIPTGALVHQHECMIKGFMYPTHLVTCVHHSYHPCMHGWFTGSCTKTHQTSYFFESPHHVLAFSFHARTREACGVEDATPSVISTSSTRTMGTKKMMKCDQLAPLPGAPNVVVLQTTAGWRKAPALAQRVCTQEVASLRSISPTRTQGTQRDLEWFGPPERNTLRPLCVVLPSHESEEVRELESVSEISL